MADSLFEMLEDIQKSIDSINTKVDNLNTKVERRLRGDDKRRHPLVIDRVTKLARLATQDDILRMEAICVAYDAIMRDFAEKLRMSEHLQKQLENAYGR